MRWRADIARSLIAGSIAAAGAVSSSHARLSFEVSFDDPGRAYAPYYGSIGRSIRAAGEEWAMRLDAASRAVLQVEVTFEDIATASTGSVTNWYAGQYNGYSLYEQGAAYEARTGQDPNGKAPDIHIALGRNGYLQNELWFDPSPARQLKVVPLDRTDARSLFLHELGHAFGFSGWRDGLTGALPDGYESTFDAWVQPLRADGASVLAFAGPAASSLYGGPVPLTFGSYAHLGNIPPLPGSDLAGDLMTGVSIFRGTRYHVSPLDWAILQDAESLVPMGGARLENAHPAGLLLDAPPAAAVPEPSTWLLVFAGLLIMAGRLRTREAVRQEELHIQTSRCPIATLLTGALISTLTLALPARAESRGELLYSTHCIACHTAQKHWRDKRLATNWNSLEAEVRRWQASAMLGWSEQDILDVTRYLNDRFYRFAQTSDPLSSLGSSRTFSVLLRQ